MACLIFIGGSFVGSGPTRSSRNMSKEVIFYDPHPGVGGALVPLPEYLRIIAHWLVGQTMTVQAATDYLIGTVEIVGLKQDQGGRLIVISEEENCILAKMGSFPEDLPCHCWRVIRFK